MDHPEEMINLIMEQYPTGAGREQLEFEARETRELMQPDLIEPGYMQQERWLQIAKTYLEAGMLTVLPNLDRFIYDPAQERLRQQRQLFDKSVAVAMLITFTLMTLLGIFLHLYLRLRQEARDRQRLTRELAQSEQHYRFVAENSADVIWTMDAASLRFRYVSPAITPLSGYEAPELFALPSNSCCRMPQGSCCARRSPPLWRPGSGGNMTRLAGSFAPNCATRMAIW